MGKPYHGYCTAQIVSKKSINLDISEIWEEENEEFENISEFVRHQADYVRSIFFNGERSGVGRQREILLKGEDAGISGAKCDVFSKRRFNGECDEKSDGKGLEKNS